jgi:uncharacterized delta-60 repeat protein
MIFCLTGRGKNNRYSIVARCFRTCWLGKAFLQICGPLSVIAASGDLDPSFDAGHSINGTVQVIAQQWDRKLVIAGTFTRVFGNSCGRIARLNHEGIPDRTFMNGMGGADAPVMSVVLQPDRKILVAGSFLTMNRQSRQYLTRLHPDGSLDETFGNVSSVPDDRVNCLALQADGRILIGGDFKFVSGIPRNRIARLNPDGTLDLSFGHGLPGANNQISAIALQQDGKIVIGGSFTRLNGESRNRIGRLNSDGTLDGFGENRSGVTGQFAAVVRSIAIQRDAKVLIGGDFTAVNGLSRFHIARLHVNGDLDGTFGRDSFGNDFIVPNASVFSISLQDDGKILFAGNFTSVRGYGPARIGRVNTDGIHLDTGFGSLNPSLEGPDATVHCVATDPDGKVLVGGNFNKIHGEFRSRIARVHNNATLDKSFGRGFSGANEPILSLALQPDGKILVGGGFTDFNGIPRDRIARLKSDQSIDETFGPVLNIPGQHRWVNSITIHSDGRMLLGMGRRDNGATLGAVIRIGSDGGRDLSFGNGAVLTDGQVQAAATQSDKKIIIAGYFTKVESHERTGVARLTENGQVDQSFNPRITPGFINSVVIQKSGKLLLGGLFTNVNDTPITNLVRLNPEGTIDESFRSAIVAPRSGYVLTVIEQLDGKILVGGSFTIASLHGVRSCIARLNANGSVDTSFGSDRMGLPRAENTVASIALGSDGKIVLGGWFTAVNLKPRYRVARMNSDGTLDDFFGSTYHYTDNPVFAVAVQPDRRILIGGYFYIVNGEPRMHIARLLGDSEEFPIFIRPAQSNVVLHWTDPTLTLQSALAVEGPFNPMPEASSPYTNSTLHHRMFFRLRKE